MENSKMLINSEGMTDLKKDDHIFNTELESTPEGVKLITREFIFNKYLNKKDKSHIKDLELSEDSIPAEIFDIRFPKTVIKTDICCGYFKTEKESAFGFITNLKDLVNLATACYVKQYGSI